MTTRSWKWVVATAVLAAGVSGSERFAAAAGAARGTVKDIEVVAERYKFTPDRIEVNQGDTVRITVRSADGTHGFAIKKLHVEETVPKGGKPITLEFVADQPGSFAITCSEYCGRGHKEMKAVLEVAAAGQGGVR